MEWLPQLIPIGAYSALLILFIKYWANNIRKDIDSKVDKNVYDIYTKLFEEAIGTVNIEVKESFDKLLTEMKDQGKINGELKVELAKLTQRVDDLARNNIKRNVSVG